MRYNVKDNMQLTVNFEDLKEKIYSISRWHSKRRRADSTRIWKIMYNLLVDIANDSPEYVHSPLFEIEFFPDKAMYSFQYHHRGHICYRGYIAKEKAHNHNETISKLNKLFSHYNLTIVEETEKQAEAKKALKRNRLYRVIFAENK